MKFTDFVQVKTTQIIFKAKNTSHPKINSEFVC